VQRAALDWLRVGPNTSHSRGAFVGMLVPSWASELAKDWFQRLAIHAWDNLNRGRQMTFGAIDVRSGNSQVSLDEIVVEDRDLAPSPLF
jgi:hypothetical protein